MSRLFGLLGRSSLKEGEGLIIEPCSSIHTAFMRFTIDVVFIDKEGVVLKVLPRLRPFRAGGVFKPSCTAVELPAGTVEATGTTPGDRIRLLD